MKVSQNLDEISECTRTYRSSYYQYEGMGQYEQITNREYITLQSQDSVQITMIALHEQDPLFLAIELSGGSFDFGQHPYVSLVFGILFILMGLSCCCFIVQSCSMLQVKEDERIRRQRRQRYEYQEAMEREEKRKHDTLLGQVPTEGFDDAMMMTEE